MPTKAQINLKINEMKKVTIHNDFSVTLFTENGNVKYTK